MSWRTCVVVKQIQSNPIQCLQGKVSAENKEWVCATCLSHLKKNKCPPCAVVNGMSFPPVPEELKDIHPLEARLLAPRIPFMKLHAAPSGGRYKYVEMLLMYQLMLLNYWLPPQNASRDKYHQSKIETPSKIQTCSDVSECTTREDTVGCPLSLYKGKASSTLWHCL